MQAILTKSDICKTCGFCIGIRRGTESQTITRCCPRQGSGRGRGEGRSPWLRYGHCATVIDGVMFVLGGNGTAGVRKGVVAGWVILSVCRASERRVDHLTLPDECGLQAFCLDPTQHRAPGPQDHVGPSFDTLHQRCLPPPQAHLCRRLHLVFFHRHIRRF